MPNQMHKYLQEVRLEKYNEYQDIMIQYQYDDKAKLYMTSKTKKNNYIKHIRYIMLEKLYVK